MRTAATAVALAFLAQLFADGAVVPIPLVPGIETSPHHRLVVNGVEVPVGVERAGGQSFATASCLFSGRVDVRVTVAGRASNCTIRPLRFGLTDKAKITPTPSGQELRFSLREPRKLIIELDGLPPLVLIGSPADDHQPSDDDPNVLYFGPGVHEPGRIRLKSNQTVYLAAGAKVYGTIEASCVENVRVTGRGHLYGSKHTDWNQRTYGIIFDRCRNVRVEQIGIRDCYWWTTEFLLCEGVTIRDINVLSFNRNNGGLMIDSCSNLVARDSLLMTNDDCICPHALNAAGNGEEVSENMMFEDMVLYNVLTGNAIRIGASFETREVRNWTFRNIDVVQRRRGGSAIYSDHSDWAVVRNLTFENVADEDSHGNAVDMLIGKTRYSCQTGYRDERGSFDGLTFINVTSRGGKFRLSGFDEEHGFRNVSFSDCRIGGETVDVMDDLATNKFVSDVQFGHTGEHQSTAPDDAEHIARAEPSASPDELVIDDGDDGFRAFGFVESSNVETAYGHDARIGKVMDAFGSYAAAIYEPRIAGRYEVFAHCPGIHGTEDKAAWIIKHRDGYSRAYVNQADRAGWTRLGEFSLVADSNVRLVYPDYFERPNRPVVADAVRFVRTGNN